MEDLETSIVSNNNIYENNGRKINKKNIKYPSIEKEKLIYNIYGDYYTDFFEDCENGTPMFVDTNNFRTTKTVYTSVDLVIEANKVNGILFDPFSTISPLTMITFDNISPVVKNLGDFRERIKSFTSYKVVAACLKIKQVSILSMMDGYGTVLEGVLVPNSFDPMTQGLNSLNVNVDSKFKIDTVDGRLGLKMCLLGSPYSDWISVSEPRPMTNLMHFFAGEYDIQLPMGTLLDFTLGDSGVIRMYDANGEEFQPRMATRGFYIDRTCVKINSTVPFTVSKPMDGMKGWIKITPSNQNVTFKLIYKVALELVPGVSLLEHIQTFAPPFFYSTERIFTSIYNNYNVIDILENKNSYASPQHMIKHLIASGKKKEIIDNEEKEKIIKDKMQEIFDLDNKFKEEKKKFKDEIDMHTSYAADPKQIYAFFPKNIVVQDRKEEQQVTQIPEYFKHAIEFCGENISKIDSKQNYSRLLKNSYDSIPVLNYQYFPVINEGVIKDAVLCVKEGNVGDLHISISLIDRLGVQSEVKLYINKKDFKNPNSDLNHIASILIYLNRVYFAMYPKEFTIRIFAPTPIDGNSYGAPLILAVMNAYPGQYSSGTLVFNAENKTVTFEKLDGNGLKKKSELATGSCPIMLPAEKNNIEPYLVSGVMLNINGSKLFTYRTAFELIMFAYITPRLRGVTRTPLSPLVNEISLYLSNLNVSPARQYIYLSLYAPSEVVMSKINNPNEKIKFPANAFSKCDPKNYGKYVLISNGKHYYDIDEVSTSFPSLLKNAKVKFFDYKGVRFYNLNSLLSVLPRELRKLTTPEIKNEIDKLYRMLETMKSTEIVPEYKKNHSDLDFSKTIDKNFANKLQQNRIYDINNNPMNVYKNIFSEFKKRIDKLKNDLNVYQNGVGQIFTNNNIPEVLELRKSVHSKLQNIARKNPNVLMLESVYNRLGNQDFKITMVDLGFSKLQRPSGKLKLDTAAGIVKEVMEQFPDEEILLQEEPLQEQPLNFDKNVKRSNININTSKIPQKDEEVESDVLDENYINQIRNEINNPDFQT